MPFNSFPFPSASVGTGKISNIHWVPTVLLVRTPRGPRWAPLTDAIVAEYTILVAEGINEFTNRIADQSLIEVPKGPRGNDEVGVPGELADSIHYPANDPETRATPDELWATIRYDAEYAHVQHEGMAVMIHHHPIIPGRKHFFEKTNVEAEIVVEWVAREYTTPGTKSHFLSDPEKAMAPLMEVEVGAYVKARMFG